ncbi:nucleotidyltransferase domain-containing protein [Patescibacteria group bacterium]|nr:nucleotidyltransferase domain-containing protein [Patescibacteria group bacterium]MBU0879640.1 nucleotidyltransferase domain-containing protein [Patescibacteria group bacterium]MBU0897802.1 nucleotidyltransferase domain-containing protein [Patescibacteria group bacterium]MBU1062954.1 nucleotidyltransferase domain-containing protein [Patescibacteria group bacterium]MBU1782977.1 nucleotidyltransferase domain-containing protein [Patescibacteria group bacterium]
MRLEHYSSEKLKKEILDIISKYLNLLEYKVFFFGSRVNNIGNERSDIDIGILGSKPIDFSTMAKIRDDIENIKILYIIDIVDFKKTSKAFQKVALENIEVLER